MYIYSSLLSIGQHAAIYLIYNENGKQTFLSANPHFI